MPIAAWFKALHGRGAVDGDVPERLAKKDKRIRLGVALRGGGCDADCGVRHRDAKWEPSLPKRFRRHWICRLT